MNPKLSRRSLLAGALGATQLALLDRFTRSSARACVRDDGPSRLLVLYLPGGVRFYPLFVPMRDEDVATTIPPTQSPGSEPIFCGPEDLVSFSGDSGGFSPLRMSRNWNPDDPGDRTGYRFSPMGYSWLHYELGATTAALHGIDQ
ncbi:MAG: hypothetical protein KC586_15585, partial [Myxococcales bacterium]|nr:hypothetical protein [Myxococcales bacterium]